MAERPHNDVYRKVAIENSYAVEELPDGTKRIVFQPIIYISTTNEKNLTIIEFNNLGVNALDNGSGTTVKDNNNLPNPLALTERPSINADTAAAIAGTLPQMINKIEQEEKTKTATGAINNYQSLQTQMPNPFPDVSEPNTEVLTRVVDVSSDCPILQKQMVNSTQDDQSESDKENSKNNFDASNSSKSLQEQMKNVNEVIFGESKKNSVHNLDRLNNYKCLQVKITSADQVISGLSEKISTANFRVSKMNIFEPQEDLILTRSYKSHNNNIKMYCSECQTVQSKLQDTNCCICQSLLQFQCTKCTQLFESYTAGENHFKSECGVKLECSQCHRSFCNEKTLKIHIQKYHVVSDKLFKCKICGKTFHSKYSQSRHEASKTCHSDSKLSLHSNSGSKPLTCIYCSHKARNVRSLQVHTFQKHQEHLPEQCARCEKKFTSIKSLQSHMIRVHKEKKNRSMFFKNPFAKSDNLKTYARKHYCYNSYYCDDCGFRDSNKKRLIMHIRKNHASNSKKLQ